MYCLVVPDLAFSISLFMCIAVVDARYWHTTVFFVTTILQRLSCLRSRHALALH